MDREILAIMQVLQHWRLYLHYTYMVRSSLCIRTINHKRAFSHNRISPLLNYTGLRILLILFHGIVFNAPRDLLTSFHRPSLHALIT